MTQSTSKRALLLLNRRARSGAADITAALDRLREAGIELLDREADQPSMLSPVIREHREKVDLVILGGGDGTISRAADGLVETKLLLGVLPLGTANDLARTLEIPTDPLAAAEVIIDGHQRTIDLGWVNNTHFFNVASIGLATGVTRRLSHSSKSRWGVFAYLFAAANVVIRAKPFWVEISSGNEKIVARSVQVSVGNGKHYGGGMVVDERAEIDDGLLNLYSLEVEHWWQMIHLAPKLWRGTLRDSPRARTLEGKEFEIRLLKKKPKLIMADGEESGRTPATFRIVPSALSVIVPKPVTPPPE